MALKMLKNRLKTGFGPQRHSVFRHSQPIAKIVGLVFKTNPLYLLQTL